jgi:hypothetical protein
MHAKMGLYLYDIELQCLLNSIAYKCSPDDSLVDIEILSETEANNAQKVGVRVTDRGAGMNRPVF